MSMSRNITSGRGIAQSAFNYNEPHFSPNDPMPRALYASAAALSTFHRRSKRIGSKYADAALLLPSLVLESSCSPVFKWLADSTTNDRLLSGQSLTFSFPLRYVASFAWSESLGIGFVFVFLFQSGEQRDSKAEIFFSLLSGLFCGLAFGTRYALLPAFFVGLIFLFAKRSPYTIRNVVFYVLGFAVPGGLVLARNWTLAKELFGSALNRPSFTWIDSFALSADTLFHSIGILDANDAVGLLALSLVFCAAAYTVTRGNFQELWKPLVRRDAFLLPLWIVVYLA
jgi:hypothetical protein